MSDTPAVTASGAHSVAAHTIGNAFAGDLVLPLDVLNAARTIETDHGTGNLAPRPVCVGRDEDLAWLRRVLTSDGSSAVTQASTVHGLGGIGKTTLALHYAHRYRDHYALTWWINAESPARIERSMADLGLLLYPSWAGKAAEQERTAWAIHWLHCHRGWLLVFDNAEDPADLRPYTGALAGGHHLITTRRATGWPRTTPTRALGTLAPEEAARLLCSHASGDTEPTPGDLRDARLLAADLGHLPLALDQAGAYLAQHPTVSIDTYRRTLDSKLAKAADGVDPERTITRTWTHTLAALEERNPLAITVLNTLAWIAPDDIPVTLLGHLDTEEQLAEALGLLRSYSMITLTRDTLGIHRLVQTVLRKQPDHPGRRDAERALDTALDALPEPEQHRPAPAWDRLVPHLTALAATTPPDHREDLAARHYFTAAQYLYHQGHDARTIPLRHTVLADCEQRLGDTHPDTLTSRHNLAASYDSAGHLDRAVAMYEATLAQSETILGHTHPHTLATRNNLAAAYESVGRVELAIALAGQNLAQCEAVLGETHPNTIAARSNLAHIHASTNGLSRAIPLLESTLAQCEAVLGETHLDTLVTRNNLATAYATAGDPHRAIPIYETALEHSEQILGTAHPQTLASRSNLAHAYRKAGDLDRAVALSEANLPQCEAVLGEAHPDTIANRSDLAFIYSLLGRLDRALLLYETVLAQREQTLGTTHPDTLVTRNNVAYICQELGDLDRAIPLYESVLAQAEQDFGPTHANTVVTRENLARAQRAGRRSGLRRRLAHWWRRGPDASG
ncbi:FxSxx-COOH system tetratricopeptide repeat protein [Kitasatospora sp. NPDC048239]|uniref:FxSxx-COOH system tetratricopeptide repeat protein n=1 Tax=Kitasatospora sp. NPDC048239 TaxID=3364046 RepID=UPI003721D5C1